jgi:hypothetical protein
METARFDAPLLSCEGPPSPLRRAARDEARWAFSLGSSEGMAIRHRTVQRNAVREVPITPRRSVRPARAGRRGTGAARGTVADLLERVSKTRGSTRPRMRGGPRTWPSSRSASCSRTVASSCSPPLYPRRPRCRRGNVDLWPGGVREVDARGDGQDLEGADFAAAVPASVVTGSVRDRFPGQARGLFMQSGQVPYTVGIQCAPC